MLERSNFKCSNAKKFYVCALVGVLIKLHDEVYSRLSQFCERASKQRFPPITQQALASEETLCFVEFENMDSRESRVLSGRVIQYTS